MKNIPEPKIVRGFPQDLDETILGTQLNSGKKFFQRFLLLNKNLLENAPFHIAVHIIKDLNVPPDPYAKIHCHPSHDEIGLILAPKDMLQYELILDGKENHVKSPAAVYIPAGTSHRARAVSGNGAYVCILLDPQGPSSANVNIP
ncbi:MAG TPA: cupin domain-containing protein [Thermodesulfovibrionales bacterium]|nr:cupin domain-containing protein [Thermodesulfovibrionales bacterium]